MCENGRNGKAETLIFAFIMPVALVLPAFAAVGVYPFGGQSLLIVDMYNEYIDYLAQMNETIHSSGSLLRSWNMGMGLNMLGLIAFYASSPLNIIVLLLPLSVITEAVFIVTLLKLGLAGLFFAVFVRAVFPEADKSLHVAFSVSYALMGYNVAYSSNIMWLDGSACLPLVLLGAEKILRAGRHKLFMSSLILVFFTSYYIGYMIGIFSFLYFTASYFSRAEPPSKNSIRAYARMLPRFLGSAALAAGCCAFLLLPAFFNLKSGQSEMWTGIFGLKLRYPVIRLAAKLLPGAYDSLTDSGLPNIFCTILAVMLCSLYFCAKTVPRREKFIFGSLLCFIIFSFSCEFFDIAWHAFEVPTWFPARYSFIFSFLVLFLGLKCACVLESIPRRAIIASAAALILLFTEIAVSRFRFITWANIIAGIVLVLLYTVILMLWKNGVRRVLTSFLVVLACMEAFGGATFTVLGLDNQFGYKSRDAYKAFMRDYGGAVKRVQAWDDGAYRCEIADARSANTAMALGYNGISHYSTTTDQKLNKFLRGLGYNKGTENELRFSISTPVTNGLLGIKYVISKNDISSSYILRGKIGDIGIYENVLAFPLVFWAPKDALSFEVNTKSPFRIQNGFISALTGEASAVFAPIPASLPVLENVRRTVYSDHIEYSRQIWNQESAIRFTIQNPDGNDAFAFFPVYNNKFSSADVFVNGGFAGRDLTYRANTVIPLGSGLTSEVMIIPQGETVRIETEYFAALDFEAAKRAAETAAQNQMRIAKFLDTVVEGSVTAPKDGILATTFPFDAGWTVRVDGEPVKPVPLAGVFLAVPVSSGEHLITMRYLPSGFTAGLAITAASVFGMLAFSLRGKRKLIAKAKALKPQRIPEA